jgi:hypothetical protein
MRPYAAIVQIDFAVTVDLVGQSGRPPSPDLAARITRAYKLRQQPVEPRQRELSGVSFCDGQDDFPQLSRFCWSVCRVSHTARIIELQGRNGRNRRHHYQLSRCMLPSRGFGAVGRANMIIFQTPNSAAERKRVARLEVARRLYQALVAQDPDRLITLRDGGGRVVARHDPRPEQVIQRLPHSCAHVS